MEDRRRRSAWDASVVSFATTISRVLGVVREQVFAALFGAGPVMDAFRVAFSIPNVLRDLFAEGTMNPAFIPTFTETSQREGNESAWRLVNQVINALLLILGLFATAVFIFAPQLVDLYEAGFEPWQKALATDMTRVMAPFILFVSLYAVMMGALLARNRLFIPSLAPAVFNVSSIVAGLILVPLVARSGYSPIMGMAIGVLLGGIGQFAIQAPLMHKEGYRYRWQLDFRHPGLRRIAAQVLPAVISLGAVQVSFAININLASGIGTGPVSWLAYAFRLIYVPIGLFGIAIATVNLRDASIDVARKDLTALRATVAAALRNLSVMTIPSTVGLIVLARPIVRVLYQHGQFSASDTEATAQALVYYAVGLFAYSCVKVLVPVFYALGTQWDTVIGSLLATSGSIGLQFALIGPLGHRGLALATSIASFGNGAFLYRRLLQKLGSMAEHRLGWLLLRVTAAALVMGAATYGLDQLLARWLPLALWAAILNLAVCVVAGIVAYALACVAFGVDEIRSLARSVTKGRWNY